MMDEHMQWAHSALRTRNTEFLTSDNGVLLLDKPAGLSSAQVVARLKRITRAPKVGHTGTLDPFATGLLICCFNQATRLAQFFLSSLKTYQATMRLGVTTDTQDITGQILRQVDLPVLTSDDINDVLARFKGQQQQQPPAFSALKHRGTPLYKLARQGRKVEKAPRPITIRHLELLAFNGLEVTFTVTCSAGTYIRTLAHDIGNTLGCGACLQALCRTGSGHFSLNQALALESIEAPSQSRGWPEALIPMAQAVAHLPTHVADRELAAALANGRRITLADIPPKPEDENMLEGGGRPIKVVDPAGQLLAVLEAPQNGIVYRYHCTFKALDNTFG